MLFGILLKKYFIMKKSRTLAYSPVSGKYFVWIFTIIVLVISLLDMAGWIFNLSFLKSIDENWIPMKVITAISFILSAASLIIIYKSPVSGFKNMFPKISGFLVLLIGLVSCWVHFVLLKTGNESSLSLAPFFNLFLSPGNRMAFLTAGNFTLIGIILILLSFERKIFTNISHIFILPVLAVSYLVQVSYLLGVHALHSVNNITVALNTGIAFSAISLAVLYIDPCSWFMKVFTSRNTGGLMARRLLPGLLILPVAIAWFRIYGERAEVFESEVGVVLVALTYTICLVFLTWLSARSVNRTDEKRRTADEAMQRSEEKLKNIFTSMNEGLVYHEMIYNEGKAVDYIILDVNPAFVKITGLTRDNAIGARATKLYGTEFPPYLDIYARVAAGGGHESFETFFPPMKKHFEISVFAPEQGKFATVFTDITTRKNAEDILQKSHEELEELVKQRTAELTRTNSLLEKEIAERSKAEEAVIAERKRFNDVLELLPAYLILLSEDYHVPYANKYFRERFGESKGKRCYEYLFNRTEPCEICETYKVFKTNMPLTWDWTGPDGRNYSIFDFPFTDVDGSRLVMEMGIDVTELKQKESEIMELNTVLEHKVEERTGEVIKINEQLKRSQEIAHLGSWELDLVNNVLFWSDEVYRIFGLQLREFGATYEAFLEAVHPDDREKVNNAYSNSIKEGKDSYEIEHRIVKKHTNEIRYVHEKCTYKRNESGEIILSVGMVHDITERKIAEKELQESMEDLKRFNKAAIGRELRMIELKKEINKFCDLTGRKPIYNLDSEEEK